MVTIEATGVISGHAIRWLFDGANEATACKKARGDFTKKGLKFVDYILVS